MIKKYKDYNKEDLKVVILKNFEANFPHLKGKYTDIDDIPNSIDNISVWFKYWEDELNFINADICDRMLALAQFNGIPIRQCYNEIEKLDNKSFVYDGEEYIILTNEEADEEEYEIVKNNIESTFMYDLKDNPAAEYVDIDRWTEDWCGNRGTNIAWYDGIENVEEINDITYYLYRRN